MNSTNNIKYLTLVNDFAVFLLGQTNINSVCRNIVNEVARGLHFEDCVLYLISDDGQFLIQEADFRDQYDSREGKNDLLTIKVGEGIVGAVAKSGIAEIINDTTIDKRHILDEANMHSELTIPIIVNSEVIGVIDSEHSEKNFFTQKHLETLQIIANLSAIKIKNEQLLIKQKKENKALQESIRNYELLNEELKKAKGQAEESEHKFQELFEKSADAVLIIENGVFVDCNQATVDMLKFETKEEFINSHPSKLSPKQQPDGQLSRQKADQMIETALKVGRHQFEWIHRKNNGEDFPVEVILISPGKPKDKKTLYTVWRDLTEQKRNENALIEKEKQLQKSVKVYESLNKRLVQSTRQLFATKEEADENSVNLSIEHARSTKILEESIDAVITIDQNQTILYCNDATTRMFGYTKSELLNKSLNILLPDDVISHHESYVNKNVNSKVSKVIGKNRDLEMIKKNGATFWSTISVAKTESQNGVEFTAFIKEISTRIEDESVQ